MDQTASRLTGFFESYYRLRPVNATFTGVHAHDHRLPDWSPEGLEAAADDMRGVRAALNEPEPSDDGLRDVAARDRELARAFLDIQLAEDRSAHFVRGNPSLAAGEALFGVISLMTRPFAPAAERAEAAIDRLRAIPRFLTGATRSIKSVPDEWRTRTLKDCDGADRLLDGGIAKWTAIENIDAPAKQALTDAARDARRAFHDFRHWLIQDVTPAPADHYSCGGELFDLLLRRGHSCLRSRPDLAKDASDRLEDACATLNEAARRAAPGGWPEVQARLADTHPSRERYLAAFQETWDACRAGAAEHDLVSWPEYPIRYVPIPVQTRDAAPFLYYLFYRSPAPFDRLPTHDYVVTPIEGDMPADEQRARLRAANASVIKLNHVVHHGAIGHHVQNFHAYAGPSEIGRVAAVDCASRIGMFAGGTMAEGWACYATDLMDEVGFLTADESLAQQHTRARLLARAVADIGLHSGTLTFDAACALYREKVGMSPDAARGEACKNSMFPATAVMYWLGTEGIHQLRAERRRVEGRDFSLRRFHDRLLGFGSIPVPLIARIW